MLTSNSGWELGVELATWKEFEEMVSKEFAGLGPYPTYTLPSTTKTTTPPTTTSDTSAPSYGHFPSPPKPAYPLPLVAQSACRFLSFAVCCRRSKFHRFRWQGSGGNINGFVSAWARLGSSGSGVNATGRSAHPTHPLLLLLGLIGQYDVPDAGCIGHSFLSNVVFPSRPPLSILGLLLVADARISAHVIFATNRAGISEPSGTTTATVQAHQASVLLIRGEKPASPWLLVKSAGTEVVIVQELNNESDPVTIASVHSESESFVRIDHQRSCFHLHFETTEAFYCFLLSCRHVGTDDHSRRGAGLSATVLQNEWRIFNLPCEWPEPAKFIRKFVTDGGMPYHTDSLVVQVLPDNVTTAVADVNDGLFEAADGEYYAHIAQEGVSSHANSTIPPSPPTTTSPLDEETRVTRAYQLINAYHASRSAWDIVDPIKRNLALEQLIYFSLSFLILSEESCDQAHETLKHVSVDGGGLNSKIGQSLAPNFELNDFGSIHAGSKITALTSAGLKRQC
ncbi:hypothetical protein BJ138DRAFT_1105816 [Hygrophoropsis aurantiaca]|uniref:Uncharacterized protein n=1 Tax=Hygrophoropsis aurantiaca TaxID=72124 RepID=A0ACB7ZY86_9AGAM|nr:hypothetical protein BJ138DRAFT_1105816 [Hygrophoropsis aurantiaca]